MMYNNRAQRHEAIQANISGMNVRDAMGSRKVPIVSYTKPAPANPLHPLPVVHRLLLSGYDFQVLHNKTGSSNALSICDLGTPSISSISLLSSLRVSFQTFEYLLAATLLPAGSLLATAVS